MPDDLGPGDVVVVLDVIRATTTLTQALASGAVGVVPVESIEQARQVAAERGALLAGERGGHPPEGFDLGNSPRQMTPDLVGGRELVLTTTNGTRALHRCLSAGHVLTGALVNAEATARRVAQLAPERTILVCSGSRGEITADDVVGAGCLVGNLTLLTGAQPGDGARVAAAMFDAWRHDLPGLLRRSRSGRRLLGEGLGGDLPVCARVDSLPFAVALDAAGVLRKLEADGSASSPCSNA